MADEKIDNIYQMVKEIAEGQKNIKQNQETMQKDIKDLSEGQKNIKQDIQKLYEKMDDVDEKVEILNDENLKNKADIKRLKRAR